MMKANKYDRELLNLSINLRMREISEKHIKGRRKLEEKFAVNAMWRFGANYRVYQELY